MELRPLGKSDIYVSPVALGCWPIAGMTSLDVNHDDSVATLEAAMEQGVNFFDTAYAYGAQGESERLIAQVLSRHRDKIVIATKGGLAWDKEGSRVLDGSPATLRRQCEESLRRLNTDRVELLYLHAPDPQTPIAESACALRELRQAGKTRLVGASNMTLAQLRAFHEVCTIDVFQPPYNMLQRGMEADILPWCQQHDVSLATYWPLMKGLLAGKLPRDYQFPVGDGRAKYPMFQGEQWQRNQDLVDDLRAIATSMNRTVAQIVVYWTLRQAGITTVLCGAKRAYQIMETASVMTLEFPDRLITEIEAALQRRGTPVTRGAV